MADQTACGWLVIGQPVGAGLAYDLYAQRQLSLQHEQRLCSCGMRLEALYDCYMPSPLRK